jgi:hypothetical protein
MLRELSDVLQNKIVSGIGAGGLVVSAEATKGGLIDLSQNGWIVSYAGWMQIIGSIWISILILEKIGVFKLVKFVYSRIRK